MVIQSKIDTSKRFQVRFRLDDHHPLKERCNLNFPHVGSWFHACLGCNHEESLIVRKAKSCDVNSSCLNEPFVVKFA